MKQSAIEIVAGGVVFHCINVLLTKSLASIKQSHAHIPYCAFAELYDGQSRKLRSYTDLHSMAINQASPRVWRVIRLGSWFALKYYPTRNGKTVISMNCFIMCGANEKAVPICFPLAAVRSGGDCKNTHIQTTTKNTYMIKCGTSKYTVWDKIPYGCPGSLQGIQNL